MIGYMALFTALALNATANILLKIGAERFTAPTWSLDFVLQNWLLILGLMCFGLNVVFYAYALSRLPLSVAYPVMAVGGMAIIILASTLYLRESISLVQSIGFALVMVGIFLIVSRL